MSLEDGKEQEKVRAALRTVASTHPQEAAKIEEYIIALEKRNHVLSHADPFRAMVVDLYSMLARVEVFMEELRKSPLQVVAEGFKLREATALERTKNQTAKTETWRSALAKGGIVAVGLTGLIELILLLVRYSSAGG